MDDVFSSILPVLAVIIVVVAIFTIFCTDNRDKVIIRGTPSVVASSSVHVNVYGGNQNNQTAAPGSGGGPAYGGCGDQRKILNFSLISSTKAPFTSTRDISKVVHGASRGGAKDVTIVIDGISGKVNTTNVCSSHVFANKCDHVKGYPIGVSVNGGGPSGDRGNGGCGSGNDGVGSGAADGGGGSLNNAK